MSPSDVLEASQNREDTFLFDHCVISVVIQTQYSQGGSHFKGCEDTLANNTLYNQARKQVTLWPCARKCIWPRPGFTSCDALATHGIETALKW